MLEEIMKNIQPELFILIPFIWFIGFMFKQVPNAKDWKIPFYLWLIAVVFAILYLAFIVIPAMTFIQILIVGVIQGTFIVAAAVFGNELFKQAKYKRLKE